MGDSSKKMSRRPGPKFMVVRGDGSRSSPRKPIAREENLFPVVIEFRRGSSAPSLKSLDLLCQCGQWLARRRGERVTVVGHANSRGSDTLSVGSDGDA